MEQQSCIFLGIKVKPGPIERFKLENYTLDNTVDNLKYEAEKKTNVPSACLELIHHGKVLKVSTTLQDSGVKNGEMVHVVKKKPQTAATPTPRPRYTDAELQQLNSSLRTLGCTPNAPGWTRAMQLLNEEPVMSEIIDQAPSLGEDCVALSILHEVELLAALGANVQTMRRGADAHAELPVALRHLTRLVRARADTATNDNVPTSGFAYSLEALSEDEDAEEEETEATERGPITPEQLALALQAASEGPNTRDSLMRLLWRPGGALGTSTSAERANPETGSSTSAAPSTTTPPFITPEMFNDALTDAMRRASQRTATDAPMEQNTEASSSQSPFPPEVGDYTSQLSHMHEMGLLDDALNIRALLISAGDVNAAINLVFSGVIGDD